MSESHGVAARRQMSPGTSSSPQTGRHGDPVRGLASIKLLREGESRVDPKLLPKFEGRFGRMFPLTTHLKPADFSLASLERLGAAMSASRDAPKDGSDEEESGIPALYTYFGQFIDHDITFDPVSSLQSRNDPNALIDYRTPALDLDSLYGRGPSDQPYLYIDPPNQTRAKHFLLGEPIHGGNAGASDLPRNGADPARALIGDPRNDENSIVSQLQGIFLRFHNRTADDNPRLEFDAVQQRVRFHYQHVILHDFLPRIVHPSVLEELKSWQHYDKKKLRFFHWGNEPFIPVEFSVAAYRLGHSMVRPGYRLNDATLRPIFPVFPDFPEGLTGFQAMNPKFGIDWARFIDIEIRSYDGSPTDDFKRLQFAYRIDTSLANPLSGLPPAIASDPLPSLAERNLRRGLEMGLPSGQAVARAMGIKPLADKEIRIGKAVDAQPDLSIVDIDEAFAGQCPLWTYILAEAMHHAEPVPIPVKESRSVSTPRLGPVGGRIVAEVLLGLMFGDCHSLLNHHPRWEPDSGPNFALKDFVKYALGQ